MALNSEVLPYRTPPTLKFSLPYLFPTSELRLHPSLNGPIKPDEVLPQVRESDTVPPSLNDPAFRASISLEIIILDETIILNVGWDGGYRGDRERKRPLLHGPYLRLVLSALGLCPLFFAQRCLRLAIPRSQLTLRNL